MRIGATIKIIPSHLQSVLEVIVTRMGRVQDQTVPSALEQIAMRMVPVLGKIAIAAPVLTVDRTENAKAQTVPKIQHRLPLLVLGQIVIQTERVQGQTVRSVLEQIAMRTATVLARIVSAVKERIAVRMENVSVRIVTVVEEKAVHPIRRRHQTQTVTRAKKTLILWIVKTNVGQV